MYADEGHMSCRYAKVIDTRKSHTFEVKTGEWEYAQLIHAKNNRYA